MPKTIVLATTNAHKAEEMRAILAPLLPPDIVLLSLSDLPPVPDALETGATFEENALLKAHHYARETGHLCLADDSGLCVDALAGAPGIYSNRWAGPGATDRGRIEKLLAELDRAKAVSPSERRARFVCAAAAADTTGWSAIGDGSCHGIIVVSPQGAGGFGYDPVFFLPELGKTMAGLLPGEKNAVSHRARALVALVPSLRTYTAGETACIK